MSKIIDRCQFCDGPIWQDTRTGAITPILPSEVGALITAAQKLAAALAVRSGATTGTAPVEEWQYTIPEEVLDEFKAALKAVEEVKP